MYAVDERDRVKELDDFPPMCTGAPHPVLVGREHFVALAYYLAETPTEWDGTSVQLVDADSPGPGIAIVLFDGATIYSGSPNDEGLPGHPLYDRGLGHYRAYQVLESSWIREKERRNSFHPKHRGGYLDRIRHVILTFHDSTFECTCLTYSIRVVRGTIRSVIPMMTQLALDR